MTLAVALLSAGCDRFQAADESPLRVVEIVLVDQNGAVPARTVVPTGNDTAISDVPLNLSRIRVRFSKTVDGSTIQQDPGPTSGSAGDLFPIGCSPASNVEVTQAGGGGAASFTASVCYDPAGPDMVIEPAAATCRGPVPASAFRAALESSTVAGFPALVRGAVYTVRATGVKDHQGNAISFSLVLSTAADLALASDPAGPSSEPSTSVNARTSFAAFGPDIVLRFDAPLCRPRGNAADLPELPGYCAPMDVDTGSLPGVNLTVAGEEVAVVSGPEAADLHFPLSGGYDSVSDAHVGGDAGAVHLVPWLPLEDGQTYSLTVGSGLQDVTGAAFGPTRAFTFQAAPGELRVQVVQPPDGATGVYPTTDLAHFGAAGSGHGIELVASQPLASAPTVEVREGDQDGPPAQRADGSPIVFDVAPLDTRGRWYAVGARVGQGDLALKGGQRYTVLLGALASRADPSRTIPSFSWSFTTAAFSRDPALSVPAIGSAITAVNTVPGAAGELDGAFLVQYVVGKVKHDAAAAPIAAPQPGGEQFFPLLGAGGRPPSITLVKVRDAGGQACTVGCEVAGISGYLKTTTGLEIFANGAAGDPNPNLRAADRAAGKPRAGLPHSALGFLPTAPLDPGSAYQLALANIVDVNDVPLADLDAEGQLAIPFTTSPFAVRKVMSQAGLNAGASGNVLQSGARFVRVDGANPLTVELRGSPDLPAGGITTAGDPSTDPVALVDGRTGDGVPVIVAPDPASTVRLSVTPVGPIAPDHPYLLVVTNKLRARAEPPGSGQGATPFSLAFTTADATDGAGSLVCQ